MCRNEDISLVWTEGVVQQLLAAVVSVFIYFLMFILDNYLWPAVTEDFFYLDSETTVHCEHFLTTPSRNILTCLLTYTLLLQNKDKVVHAAVAINTACCRHQWAAGQLPTYSVR